MPAHFMSRLIIIAGFLHATPTYAQAGGAAEDGFSEAQRAAIQQQEAELAKQHADLDLAKAELESLKEKLKAQDAFLADLNAVIVAKGGGDGEAADGKLALPSGFLSNVTPRIVIIEGNKGNGTGFLCNSGGETWVYTAAHVLSGNTTIIVRDSAGRTYRDFEFLECAEGVDLVRLKLKDVSIQGLVIVSETEAPVVGDEIVAVGNSLGTGSISGEPGRIRSIGDDMWEVDAEIIPGNSGGPVLSLKTEKVVGIVTHLIIPNGRNVNRPAAEKRVKRFAARLDKEWEWRKMPVVRFVKEWQHIGEMDRESSIAWASTYLMHTGPEALAQRDMRYRTSSRTDPQTVKIAESILARDRKHFQVQRVDEWLKRYRNAGKMQRNELIVEGNKIIQRNLEEIRIKVNGAKAEDFSWFHRKMFEEEVAWRNKLTGDD